MVLIDPPFPPASDGTETVMERILGSIRSRAVRVWRNTHSRMPAFHKARGSAPNRLMCQWIRARNIRHDRWTGKSLTSTLEILHFLVLGRDGITEFVLHILDDVEIVTNLVCPSP